MAEIKKTSYEAIINALSREMEETPADESQERIAARLDNVRLKFRIDHDTFSLILAGIADYDPPDGPPQKPTDVKTALNNAIRQRTIQCRLTELNTEPTGIRALDLLRSVIAGTRTGDKPFGGVFRRNDLWGISPEPLEYVVICGLDGTSQSFKTSGSDGLPFAGSSVTHIEKAAWKERWPKIPYQAGNYLIRSGQYYGFTGPEFTQDPRDHCPRPAPPTKQIVSRQVRLYNVKTPSVTDAPDATGEIFDALSQQMWGPFVEELSENQVWTLGGSQEDSRPEDSGETAESEDDDVPRDEWLEDDSNSSDGTIDDSLLALLREAEKMTDEERAAADRELDELVESLPPLSEAESDKIARDVEEFLDRLDAM